MSVIFLILIRFYSSMTGSVYLYLLVTLCIRINSVSIYTFVKVFCTNSITLKWILVWVVLIFDKRKKSVDILECSLFLGIYILLSCSTHPGKLNKYLPQGILDEFIHPKKDTTMSGVNLRQKKEFGQRYIVLSSRRTLRLKFFS